SDDGSRLAFGWEISERRYRRLPERDSKKSG
ncbi:replication protein, partial [Xenorhabdus sp. ZM]|nr:replication protein [Xenorhabdus sp. ZM]